MVRRLQTFITFCLILLLSLSCVHIDNTGNLFAGSTTPSNYEESFVMVDSETYQVNSGYRRIEQQDYWSNNNATHLSTALLKRSQSSFRHHERHEVVMAVLDVVSRVALFSFIMILCAAGGTGLSMPFRCLLSYIHGMDGKKRIA